MHSKKTPGETNGRCSAVLKPGELTLQTATAPRAVVLLYYTSRSRFALKGRNSIAQLAVVNDPNVNPGGGEPSDVWRNELKTMIVRGRPIRRRWKRLNRICGIRLYFFFFATTGFVASKTSH